MALPAKIIYGFSKPHAVSLTTIESDRTITEICILRLKSPKEKEEAYENGSPIQAPN